MAKFETFNHPVGTKIGDWARKATVTTPQDLKGDSNGMAATTFQACGPGEVKEYGVEVRGHNNVRLGAVLEDADMRVACVCCAPPKILDRGYVCTTCLSVFCDADATCPCSRHVLRAMDVG